MEFEILLTYKDNKELKVIIESSHMHIFFECLNSGEAYTFPSSGNTFWTNIADVRYITTSEVMPVIEPNLDEEDEQGISIPEHLISKKI